MIPIVVGKSPEMVTYIALEAAKNAGGIIGTVYVFLQIPDMPLLADSGLRRLFGIVIVSFFMVRPNPLSIKYY